MAAHQKAHACDVGGGWWLVVNRSLVGNSRSLLYSETYTRVWCLSGTRIETRVMARARVRARARARACLVWPGLTRPRDDSEMTPRHTQQKQMRERGVWHTSHEGVPWCHDRIMQRGVCTTRATHQKAHTCDVGGYCWFVANGLVVGSSRNLL